MTWNYAELTKKVKENGGPEKFEGLLVDNGKKQMIPLVEVVGVAGIIIGVAAGVASTIGVQKVFKYFSNKNAMEDEDLELDKQDLIQETKHYQDIQDSLEEF